MVIETQQQAATRFAFREHTQRMRKLALPAAIILPIACIIIGLAFENALPQGLGMLVVAAFVLGILSFIVLVPLTLFFYSYSKGGLWLDEQGVRVKFPAEAEQRMDWSAALYAVDEGEEYLVASKGKEGLGHLIGKERYVRLHLEGMLPEQRTEIRRAIAEHVEVRQPRKFTFATLLNSKGEIVARGRLYRFEKELLCMENRGEKRVFIAGPLKKIGWIRRREPFYVGKLTCEAFILSYDKKDFMIMLGYETTLRGGLGTTSSWSATGSAEEWIEALQSVG